MPKPPRHTSFFMSLLPTVLIWRPHQDSSSCHIQITWLNMKKTWQWGKANIHNTHQAHIQSLHPSAITPSALPPTNSSHQSAPASTADDLDAAFGVLIKLCGMETKHHTEQEWLKKQLAQYPLIQQQLLQPDTMHPYQTDLLQKWVGGLLEGHKS